MVDVRFELTTNDPWSVDDAICEALVRWATGERLTNRLPKLSLITYIYQLSLVVATATVSLLLRYLLLVLFKKEMLVYLPEKNAI